MNHAHGPLSPSRQETFAEAWQALGRSPIMSSFFSRLGLNDDFCVSNGPILPPGATTYLVDTNPRLLDLRDRYRASSHPAVQHSQWTPAFIASNVPLQAFRGDCAFVWQQREWNLPIVHVLTAYYLNSKGTNSLMTRLGEDNLFGVYTVPWLHPPLLSRDLLDSVSELCFLDKWLGLLNGQIRSILDIGAGYGRLAHRALQAVPTLESYICADAVPESTFICEYYLQFREASERARVVTVFDLDKALREHEPEIAISVHSLGECRREVIRWWLQILKRHRIRYLLLVLNPGAIRGRRFISTEGKHAPGLPFQMDLKEAGYRLLAREPKYLDPAVQQFGISPVEFFLFKIH